MTILVPSTEELPVGAHALSFHGSRPEAAHQMAGFVRGSQRYGQPARIFSSDGEMIRLYRKELAAGAPELTDSFAHLRGPHVRTTPEGLRPQAEVLGFATARPDGVTFAGDTLPGFLTRQNLADVLDYERWVDTLRPFLHRGLCPYDLARIPVDRVSGALPSLAGSHSHAVLSRDPNPGVQLLQLVVVPQLENPAPTHLAWLARAVDLGLMETNDDTPRAALTPRGRLVAKALLAAPREPAVEPNR